jgi:hypothetical protein
VKLKVDFSLGKLARVKLAVKLGLEDGAAVDVKLRLRGRDPVRWKAALGRGKTRERELPSHDRDELAIDDPLFPNN